MEGTEMKGTVLVVRMGRFGVNLVGLLGISSPNSGSSFLSIHGSGLVCFCCIVCTVYLILSLCLSLSRDHFVCCGVLLGINEVISRLLLVIGWFIVVILI